jgi:tetratricopeptide (TPR) repeat protein
MRIAALLEKDPQAAARAAAQIVRSNPEHPTAPLLLAAACRDAGDPEAAVSGLAELAQAQPASAVIHLELGRALRAAGRGDEALAALERAVELMPDLAEAWRELSVLRDVRGDPAGCDAAYARFEQLSPESARLGEAVADLAGERYEAAGRLLGSALARAPQDVFALRLLARVASARADLAEAERLLAECLRVAPGYSRARHDLVRVHYEQSKGEPMLPLLERLLAAQPDELTYRILQAVAWGLLGRTEPALEILAALAREFPESEVVWLNYGHTLRAVGRGAEAVAAYRRCLELKPAFAGAWMALADLKTFRFTPQEIHALQAELTRSVLPDDERAQLEFSLGKALEDRVDFGASFEHYASGNALRRALLRYRPESVTRLVERSRALYTREFFAARAGWGCPAPDPIFIVGLPRAGSTLLEQILASHSQVEGTRELGDVIRFAMELGCRDEESEPPPAYPQSVAALTRETVAALGERYLAQTRAQRLLGRPRFVDKMGGNFLHLGLIHLMLPNARIIDARRSPLACCVANFKQHFYRGVWFTYSLEDLGRYYRDYVSLMAHIEAVLPGRVRRVGYENLVRDLEGEVRRLLEYCGLPFE